MNKWTEQLATSLLSPDLPPSKSRRLRTLFARSIRHHNFGRTNQFEVEERLVGLEEKFQVLNFDDLSDELRQQRSELLQYQQQWVPDVLDFLLRMSVQPMSSKDGDDSADFNVGGSTEPRLTWADIEKDDPIDRSDRIWRQPVYSDLSSDDDPILTSTATSPESMKSKTRQRPHDDVQPKWATITDQATHTDNTTAVARWDSPTIQHLTEIQIIRETLHMLQGLPTSMFSQENAQIRRRPDLRSTHMSDRSLDSVLARAVGISKASSTVRAWTSSKQEQPFIRAMQDAFDSATRDFDTLVVMEHEAVIRAKQRGGTCSLLNVIETMHEHAAPVLAVANFLSAVVDQDSIAILQSLYQHTCKYEQTGAFAAFDTLSRALTGTLRVFLAPIDAWIGRGIIDDNDSTLFIERVPEQTHAANLWHGWYTVHSQGRRRLPQFLAPFTAQIFTAGKTAAFIRRLSQSSSVTIEHFGLMADFDQSWTPRKASMAPFTCSLLASIEGHINLHLVRNTETLKRVLEMECKLPETLLALSYLFLGESPYVTSVIDEEIFSRLDRAQPSWNERFLVCDILEEACQRLNVIEISRVSVQSEQTSASKLVDARQSIKILESLAIDYDLHWSVANILPAGSMASYRRVSLILTQIRRARHVLERQAFISLRKKTRSSHTAEATYSNLINFVNILQAHLMHCVVAPLTSEMRIQLKGTVDDMIAVHKSYTEALERSCLLTKNLKMVRETLMSLLDLCLDFGFRVSDAKNPMDDFALSKTRSQFRKLMNLFLAGLRGAARAGPGNKPGEAIIAAGSRIQDLGRNVGNLLELLADSLESAGFKV